VASLLLEKAADVNSRNTDGETPLSIAASSGDSSVVSLLIAKGVDINSKDQLGQASLIVAVRRGEESVVEILTSKEANLTDGDAQGRTTIHLAAGGCSSATLDKLVRKAQIDATDFDLYARDKKVRTIFHHVACNKDEDVIKYLIKQFPNSSEWDGVDKDGYTPLLWAAKFGRKSAVLFLLERGAHASHRDRIKNWNAG
jgi:ankyrin repeat protein